MMFFVQTYLGCAGVLTQRYFYFHPSGLVKYAFCGYLGCELEEITALPGGHNLTCGLCTFTSLLFYRCLVRHIVTVN